MLGSAVVFIPALYNPIVLGISLALAAGVMTYVSFVEIFFKGLIEFEDYFDQRNGVNRSAITFEDYKPPHEAYHSATGMFFAGVLLTWGLDIFIHWIYDKWGSKVNLQSPGHATSEMKTMMNKKHYAHSHGTRESTDMIIESRSDRESDRETIQILSVERHPTHAKADLRDMVEMAALNNGDEESVPSLREKMLEEEEGNETDERKQSIQKTAKDLMMMALITGTAITLHNFPEGLATFVATAKDPSVGAPVAVAIAVHNIPEGICVAIPLYFASRSKWKAFMWGTLSGFTEPLAGAVGWIILANNSKDFDTIIYAILFGLVSGMMVYISFRELLPTARTYDPDDKYITKSLFLGMLIIAGSLMMFKI